MLLNSCSALLDAPSLKAPMCCKHLYLSSSDVQLTKVCTAALQFSLFRQAYVWYDWALKVIARGLVHHTNQVCKFGVVDIGITTYNITTYNNITTTKSPALDIAALCLDSWPAAIFAQVLISDSCQRLHVSLQQTHYCKMNLR